MSVSIGKYGVFCHTKSMMVNMDFDGRTDNQQIQLRIIFQISNGQINFDTTFLSMHYAAILRNLTTFVRFLQLLYGSK